MHWEGKEGGRGGGRRGERERRTLLYYLVLKTPAQASQYLHIVSDIVTFVIIGVEDKMCWVL